MLAYTHGVRKVAWRMQLGQGKVRKDLSTTRSAGSSSSLVGFLVRLLRLRTADEITTFSKSSLTSTHSLDIFLVLSTTIGALYSAVLLHSLSWTIKASTQLCRNPSDERFSRPYANRRIHNLLILALVIHLGHLHLLPHYFIACSHCEGRHHPTTLQFKIQLKVFWIQFGGHGQLLSRLARNLRQEHRMWRR